MNFLCWRGCIGSRKRPCSQISGGNGNTQPSQKKQKTNNGKSKKKTRLSWSLEIKYKCVTSYDDFVRSGEKYAKAAVREKYKDDEEVKRLHDQTLKQWTPKEKEKFKKSYLDEWLKNKEGIILNYLSLHSKRCNPKRIGGGCRQNLVKLEHRQMIFETVLNIYINGDYLTKPEFVTLFTEILNSTDEYNIFYSNKACFFLYKKFKTWRYSVLDKIKNAIIEKEKFLNECIDPEIRNRINIVINDKRINEFVKEYNMSSLLVSKRYSVIPISLLGEIQMFVVETMVLMNFLNIKEVGNCDQSMMWSFLGAKKLIVPPVFKAMAGNTKRSSGKVTYTSIPTVIQNFWT